MTNAPFEAATPAEDGPRPLITVAICTRNRAAFLEAAIRSVLPQIHDDTEVLIVDNASTDQTAVVTRQFTASHPQVRYYYEQNLGTSFARSSAIRNARGRYVLFLDDDSTADEGWLAAYQRFLGTPPSPRIALVAGGCFPRYEVPPPAWIGPQENTLDMGDKAYRLNRQDSPYEGNSAYAREPAMQHGLFDPRLGHVGAKPGFHEGSDLNLRLQDAGYELWWLPGAGVQHTIHASRLNLRWYCRAAFSIGSSAALKRLKFARGPGARVAMRLGRLATAPFHFLANIVVFLVLYPCTKKVTAVKALRRAMRGAGYAWQLLKPLPEIA